MGKAIWLTPPCHPEAPRLWEEGLENSYHDGSTMIIRPQLKPVRKREARTPEGFLAKAMDSDTPAEREQYARAGLALEHPDFHVETRMLLMRELYRAHLDQKQLVLARDVALEMSELGPLKDVAHHDAARVCAALGDLPLAITQQRLAVLSAPPERRAFQGWSLATLEHFAGEVDHALHSLDRAEHAALGMEERAGADELPLIEAHRVYVLLDAGRPVDDAKVHDAERALEHARRPPGYGAFLLGMIAALRGDVGRAHRFLSSFVERVERGDYARAMTLREELRRARVVLAELAH